MAAALSARAFAVSDRAVDYLLKTAPRPAGMGGAFTAVPADPIGMFWNPAAALRSDRLAISGNHSLRHFPGLKKNLDQFDSDTTGITIPLQDDNVLGIGFTVSGEWGVDYTDTNGVLPVNEKLSGRERRAAYTSLHGQEQNGAAFGDSGWYRYNGHSGGTGYNSYPAGGGMSFFYEADNGMMYGVNIRGLLNRIKGAGAKKGSCVVTLGVAYRPDRSASTLAAADIELSWKKNFETRWFAGAERAFDRRAFLRAGFMNGLPTYGYGAGFGSLRLDYAVVKKLLPEISGVKDVKKFGDGHFLSYTLSL
jgi:hypothetical protein